MTTLNQIIERREKEFDEKYPNEDFEFQRTPGADGCYCQHHPDDPAHTKFCYEHPTKNSAKSFHKASMELAHSLGKKEGVEESRKVYSEYVELLENELASVSTIAFVHGISASQEKIDKGIICRQKIATLLSLLKESDSSNKE